MIKKRFIGFMLIFLLFFSPQIFGQYCEDNYDVPYVPTEYEVVKEMLKIANVSKDDILYDLGCGDGRIVVHAAEKYSARGVGVDYDSVRVAEARARAKERGVEQLVKIIHANALDVDLSEATVVTLYLTTAGNEAVRPNLEKYLHPGDRVVSHDFKMPGWEILKTETINGNDEYIEDFLEDFYSHTLYLFVIGKHKPEK